MINQEIKEDSPAENREAEARRDQPLMKQERKKPNLINIINQISSIVSVSPSLNNLEELFYQLFSKCKFLTVLEIHF